MSAICTPQSRADQPLPANSRRKQTAGFALNGAPISRKSAIGNLTQAAAGLGKGRAYGHARLVARTTRAGAAVVPMIGIQAGFGDVREVNRRGAEA